jgi:Flp pilus assembly pilin Flp
MKQFNAYREGAQGLVEYGLILAIVGLLGAAGLVAFGPAVSSLISTVAGTVTPPLVTP